MAEVDRLKQRLVRELVQENLDLIQGVPPRRLRRRRLSLSPRTMLLALLPVALLGSTRLLSTFEPSAPPPAALVATVPAPSSTIPVLAGGVAVLPATPVPASAQTRIDADLPTETVDASVFPLAVRRVVLDPGHGGDSLGTKTSQGLAEKELTLDIARRVRKLLTPEFEIVLTRDGDDEVSLRERAELANRAKADVFVSIHVNWIAARDTRGVETYYVGPTDDPFLNQLAASENRGSGYSLGDLRQLLDRIYAGVRQDNSRRLAEIVQRSLHRSLGKVNPQLGDRGVKSAPFIVLLSTEMPAILAEVSCLSNEEEARLLTKPLYRQYIAEALAQGLRSYADSVAAPERKESDS